MSRQYRIPIPLLLVALVLGLAPAAGASGPPETPGLCLRITVSVEPVPPMGGTASVEEGSLEGTRALDPQATGLFSSALRVWCLLTRLLVHCVLDALGLVASPGTAH